jgi:hypothetical protein
MGPAIGSRRARPGCGPNPDHYRTGISGATACPARLAPDRTRCAAVPSGRVESRAPPSSSVAMFPTRQVGAGCRLVARLIRHLSRPFVNLTRPSRTRSSNQTQPITHPEVHRVVSVPWNRPGDGLGRSQDAARSFSGPPGPPWSVSHGPVQEGRLPEWDE